MSNYPETNGGWSKHGSAPVLGNAETGTLFDLCVLKEPQGFRMYLSWRPRESIAVATSSDGIRWSDPVVVLGPNDSTTWEADLNRPAVVRHGDLYHMWYTGQADGHSWIGYATSTDGLVWKRASADPVVSPDLPWEKVAVMCPDVMWDEQAGLFKMWYSGGEQYEPDAIGYATSPDGATWTKHPRNPVFRESSEHVWEAMKVTACQVQKVDGRYLMFYVGFEDIDTARIGIASSADGIGGWERYERNPIVSPTKGTWDENACYKPFALIDGTRWLLWYNGRRATAEYIGLATHEGRDLGL